MESVRRVWDRVRVFFSKPKREVRSWIVDDHPQAVAEAEHVSLWGYVDGFKAFWMRVRNRVFRVLAALLALVDIILGAILYSNVWYMNLILYAYLVPSFLILIHYMRLTRVEK